jgi:hypothetical protein
MFSTLKQLRPILSATRRLKFLKKQSKSAKLLFYGESTSAECYQLLQKIRFLAKNISNDQGAKIEDNINKTALPHTLKIDDLVWYKDFTTHGKNPKLTRK